ncbi:MAG: hemerythrin domain-containing protein [Blastocatellales bacterium]
MIATELLKNDHKKVMSLIEELETADDEVGTDPTYTEIFNRLNELLKMHTRIEEEVFYPSMKDFDESRDLVREFHKEHNQIDQLLSRLSTMAPNVEEFQGILSELRERIERHVDEEENELFPLAEELCGESILQEMGRQMQTIKDHRQVKAATGRRR